MLQKIAEKLRTEQVQYAGNTYYRNIYPLVTDQQKEDHARTLKNGHTVGGSIGGAIMGAGLGLMASLGERKGVPSKVLKNVSVGTLAGTVVGGILGRIGGAMEGRRASRAGLGYSDHYDPIDAKESIDAFKQSSSKGK